MHRFLKLAIIALLLCAPIAKATDYPVYIHINDPLIISSITVQGKPIFTITGINTLIDQYTVTGFVQANPYSRLKSMRSIYSMTVSDLNLPQALVNNYPQYFGYWEEDQKYEPHYTPIDYPNISGVRNTKYLDYINAENAWNVSKGDRNTVIGIIDWELQTNHPDLVGKSVVVNNIINNTDHGTTTVGLVAGHTDSVNVGYPSIGFNCRFDFESC